MLPNVMNLYANPKIQKTLNVWSRGQNCPSHRGLYSASMGSNYYICFLLVVHRILLTYDDTWPPSQCPCPGVNHTMMDTMERDYESRMLIERGAGESARIAYGVVS